MKSLKKIRYIGHPESLYWVEDWKPLSNCKKLEIFCGVRLNISDLGVFNELINLKELYVESEWGYAFNSESKINDISDVQYLVNLEWFVVQGKEISDISALKNCQKLKRLTLRGVIATDCSALLELPNLESLDIDKGVLTENEIKTLEEKGVKVREYEHSEDSDKTE